VLTRLSGGSASLFSLSRTDNNYVNIVITPATFCWTKLQPKDGGLACPPLPAAVAGNPMIANALVLARQNGQPRPIDVQSAVDRINFALINLNLAHTLSP
jgi:hypothetical protein